MMNFRRGILAVVLMTLMAGSGFLGGCAPADKTPVTEVPTAEDLAFPGALHETPVPDGPWRGHQLARCGGKEGAPARVENLLATCYQLFREGSGSDGMIELEMALEEGIRHSLIDLTLGQLYLLAGQGEQALLPVEGPAADVGNWEKNKIRLLGRARRLLQRAARQRPDDAVADYLLADVARAAGDQPLAAEYVVRGQEKCTGGRSIEILRRYQQLNRYPARYLGGASPEYPADALSRGISGPVTIDLLLDPAARIRQAVAVSSPSPSLTRAAFQSLLESGFEAAKVGKYPVWSWMRVTISFNLDS